MGSILGGLGGSKSTTTAHSGQVLPINLRGSAGALVNIADGVGSVRLPKRTRARRNEIFSNIQGITRDVQDDILSLRRLENPFVRARVRPTEERFANLRADTQRGLDRRGVFGTFRTNELSRVDDAASRAIADQGALAQSEVLNSVFQRQGFLSSLQNALRGLNEDEVSAALAELGLGTQTVASLIRQNQQSSESEDIGGGLETAASLAGAAATFFSDRRLKTDIRLRGHLPSGLAVYDFTYVWGESGVGVMADEVLPLFPDAVSEIGGYMAVDYSRIG